MKEVTVTCTHDANDSLTVRHGHYNGSIVVFDVDRVGDASVWATPEDARRVRDALDEALREHDEKQRAAKWEQWDALGETATWGRSVGLGVATVKVNAESRNHVESKSSQCVAYICTTQHGVSLEAQQLDEVIEKLTAIREAHRALMEAR